MVPLRRVGHHRCFCQSIRYSGFTLAASTPAMNEVYSLFVPATAAAMVLYGLTRVLQPRKALLHGPPRDSLIAGNLAQLFAPLGMEHHERFTKEYGNAFEVYGLFGVSPVLTFPEFTESLTCSCLVHTTPLSCRQRNSFSRTRKPYRQSWRIQMYFTRRSQCGV